MILDLGLVDYEKAYKLQKELAAKRLAGEIDGSLLIAEHTPVFTIGRTGSRENLLVSDDILKQKGIQVLSVDRGGDITYHGPGQLVLYPIIDLKDRTRDLHKYMRDLEEAAIRLLNEYAITGRRREGMTGVWAGDKKIAFVGVAARNWVTYHGLSINVSTDLRYFSMIHPCGLKGIETTSMQALLQKDISFAEIKTKAVACIKEIFGIREEISAQYAAVA